MGSLPWKKTVLTAFTIVAAFLLTGCWDRVELNDLALIKAAAIDKTKDNKIEISAEVLIPKGGGGGGGGQAGGGAGGVTPKGTFIRSAVGENLADAISKLQEVLPRKIFWGHDKAYVFGEALAKQGIQGEMDFLARNTSVRKRANVFVSVGKARKMIDLNPPLERNEAEVLRKMAESKVIMGGTLLDLWKGLNSDEHAAAIPMIQMLQAIKAEKQTGKEMAYIKQVAIFKKDKMVGVIDDETARGVQWINNNVKTPIITIHPKESKGSISLRMLHAQTTLEPEIQKGKWKIIVKGETSDDFIQNTTDLDTTSPVIVQRLEKEVSEDITKRINQALEQVQKKMKADVFQFGQAFHRKYPQEWEKAKGRWDTIFPQVDVGVEIKAHILGPGISTKPAVTPEKEVKKK